MNENHIPVAKPNLSGNEMNYVKKCIEDNWISSAGDFVKKFERNFSDFCKTKFGVAVNSGTSALHLALAALDIGKGDEVIVPDLSFVATINTVIYTGAKPVIVDVNPEGWNIDVSEIRKNITERTKALIPVHLYGQPANMDPIMEIADNHNLYVIEDCAEAHGAEYDGKKVGGFGDISCFSFYGNKIITTGEGGMCVTDDRNLENKLRKLRNHGMSEDKRYWHNRIGYSYGMTNLQAAVGLAQLERIEDFIRKRREIEKLYDENFKNIEGLQFQRSFPKRKKVCWMYPILIDEEKYGISKERLQKKLDSYDIDSRKFFYPFHQMRIYKNYINNGKEFPIAERLSKKGLLLPTFPDLEKKKISRICKVLNQ